MSLEDYKIIIEKTSPYALHVALFLFGEPLLNKEIIQMVAYNTKKGILSTIHTNMNIMDEPLAEGLIQAGLFRLVMSIDGVTQEVYEKYRVAGHIQKVYDNIDIFLKVRRRLKKESPIVCWKYLIHRFNEDEVSAARQKCKSLGVDVFSVEYFDIPEDTTQRKKWIPRQKKYSLYDVETLSHKKRPNKYCEDLWNTLIIDCEGFVYFCCFAAAEKQYYGNILSEQVSQLWNSKQMISARKMHHSSSKGNSSIYCQACGFLPSNFYQKQKRGF